MVWLREWEWGNGSVSVTGENLCQSQEEGTGNEMVEEEEGDVCLRRRLAGQEAACARMRKGTGWRREMWGWRANEFAWLSSRCNGLMVSGTDQEWGKRERRAWRWIGRRSLTSEGQVQARRCRQQVSMHIDFMKLYLGLTASNAISLGPE